MEQPTTSAGHLAWSFSVDGRESTMFSSIIKLLKIPSTRRKLFAAFFLTSPALPSSLFTTAFPPQHLQPSVVNMIYSCSQILASSPTPHLLYNGYNNLISCCEWEWELQTKCVREAQPLSHKVQSRPPCFLHSFSEGSLGTAGSNLSP